MTSRVAGRALQALLPRISSLDTQLLSVKSGWHTGHDSSTTPRRSSNGAPSTSPHCANTQLFSCIECRWAARLDADAHLRKDTQQESALELRPKKVRLPSCYKAPCNSMPEKLWGPGQAYLAQLVHRHVLQYHHVNLGHGHVGMVGAGVVRMGRVRHVRLVWGLTNDQTTAVDDVGELLRCVATGVVGGSVAA